MQFTELVLASLAALPLLVDAHGNGIPGAPKIFGRRLNPQSRALATAQHMQEHSPANTAVEHESHLKRTTRCGPSYGSCGDGLCCSASGYCGTGTSYCMSPGCQFEYGPACDDNIIPSGTNTSSVARPHLGNVSYGGVGIFDCTVKGTIALTFDDGPYIYTNQILDILANYSVKATFFVTGNNNGKGEIDNTVYPWAATLQRMHSEGHQIAHHTWTHPHLSNLTTLQRRQQMWSNEMALRNVLGFFPTYMRPPYSDCTAKSGCQSDMVELGYHIIYYDIDTDDWQLDSPDLIQTAKNNFVKGLNGTFMSTGPANVSQHMSIAHDIHNQTAHNLTTFMLDTLLAQGYQPVTVGQCLGDPAENWYRYSNGTTYSSASSSASTSKSSTRVSTSSTGFVSSSTVTSSSSSLKATSHTVSPASSRSAISPIIVPVISTISSKSLIAASSSTNSVKQTSNSAKPVTSSTSTSSTTSTSAAASPTAVTDTGRCAGDTGLTCLDSEFGSCCSSHGWCGSTNVHCGTGCQSGFGTCGFSSSSSSSSVHAAQVSSLKASTSGSTEVTSAKSPSHTTSKTTTKSVTTSKKSTKTTTTTTKTTTKTNPKTTTKTSSKKPTSTMTAIKKTTTVNAIRKPTSHTSAKKGTTTSHVA